MEGTEVEVVGKAVGRVVVGSVVVGRVVVVVGDVTWEVVTGGSVVEEGGDDGNEVVVAEGTVLGVGNGPGARIVTAPEGCASLALRSVVAPPTARADPKGSTVPSRSATQ
jgi:hypothetical protein